MVKYRCEVGLYAEEVLTGTVLLTEEEYRTVKFATDPDNWSDVEGGSWCGSFGIYCKELEEND